jgi:hypothetical protein
MILDVCSTLLLSSFHNKKLKFIIIDLHYSLEIQLRFPFVTHTPKTISSAFDVLV